MYDLSALPRNVFLKCQLYHLVPALSFMFLEHSITGINAMHIGFFLKRNGYCSYYSAS